MFFSRLLFAAAATVSTVFAVALEERQSIDPSLTALANVPPQCSTQCAILQTYSNINPSDLSTLSAVCSSAAQTNFLTCLTCFETYSPQTFTPQLMSALTTAAEGLGTGCLLIGSPISSIAIPTPTATGGSSGGSTVSGSGSNVPSPSSASSSSSGQTNGAKRRVRAAAAAVISVLAPMGLAVFIF